MSNKNYKMNTCAAMIAAFVFVIYVHAMKIECPTLKCLEASESEDITHLQDNICF